LNPHPVPQYGHVVDTYLISIITPFWQGLHTARII
jgi:hypothetical protein